MVSWISTLFTNTLPKLPLFVDSMSKPNISFIIDLVNDGQDDMTQLDKLISKCTDFVQGYDKFFEIILCTPFLSRDHKSELRKIIQHLKDAHPTVPFIVIDGSKHYGSSKCLSGLLVRNAMLQASGRTLFILSSSISPESISTYSKTPLTTVHGATIDICWNKKVICMNRDVATLIAPSLHWHGKEWRSECIYLAKAVSIPELRATVDEKKKFIEMITPLFVSVWIREA
ncbi:hypothetical protein ADUPG1_008135 [Aduncisulcus paluster]|uniref:Uncharacterized protein n=1 Tax=Aduncisulcus paluster TaxID=2918883 RepID=A0ABQ5KS67_9EUKA|nr:hypothetical protein ADUPG1_008135 [Aduncisulcus paluster]